VKQESHHRNRAGSSMYTCNIMSTPLTVCRDRTYSNFHSRGEWNLLAVLIILTLPGSYYRWWSWLIRGAFISECLQPMSRKKVQSLQTTRGVSRRLQKKASTTQPLPGECRLVLALRHCPASLGVRLYCTMQDLTYSQTLSRLHTMYLHLTLKKHWNVSLFWYW